MSTPEEGGMCAGEKSVSISYDSQQSDNDHKLLGEVRLGRSIERDEFTNH